MKTPGLLLTGVTLCLAVASAMLILADTWSVRSTAPLVQSMEAAALTHDAAMQERVDCSE